MRIAASVPINEQDRLKKLQQYQILDTDAEQAFDDLTALAAYVCGTPIALISLVDSDRQWFKSRVGLEATETVREVAFCAHALSQADKVMIVPNALEDERFATNPLVTSSPNIRFYAGVPLVTPDGFPLGTLCVMDLVPRDISPAHITALLALSHQVMSQMELRINLARLKYHFSQLGKAEKKSVNIHEGIDNTLLFLQHRLKPTDHSPEIKIIKEYGNFPDLECYAAQLNQVFMNILNNAIDAIKDSFFNPHSPLVVKSKGIIRIVTESHHSSILVRITDNGSGISEAIQKRIFEPFFTSKSIGKGTGLGLSICYQIVVKKHKGSLYCKTKPGMGTEFYIEVPLRNY